MIFFFTQVSLYCFSFFSLFQFFSPFLCFGSFFQMNEIWVEHWSQPDFRLFNFTVDLFFYFYPDFVVFFQLLLRHLIFLTLSLFWYFFHMNQLSRILVTTKFQVIEGNIWSLLLFLLRFRCKVSTSSLFADFSHPFFVLEFFSDEWNLGTTLVTAKFQAF